MIGYGFFRYKGRVVEFVARFEDLNGHLFRFDTRIYLETFDPNAKGQCIGAIIRKNPGSAKPSTLNKLEPLILENDKMLPFVGNRFQAAYNLAKKSPPPNAFVRVWNLFYICNADLAQAKNAYASFREPPVCETEGDKTPLIWFGWGGDHSEAREGSGGG